MIPLQNWIRTNFTQKEEMAYYHQESHKSYSHLREKSIHRHKTGPKSAIVAAYNSRVLFIFLFLGIFEEKNLGNGESPSMVRARDFYWLMREYTRRKNC